MSGLLGQHSNAKITIPISSHPRASTVTNYFRLDNELTDDIKKKKPAFAFSRPFFAFSFAAAF